jgi:hypothetical protein
MSDILAIVAVAVLLGLAALSIVRKRRTLSVEKEEAHVRSHAGDAQHERSASRLAAIRSAPEQTADVDAEPPSTASRPPA